MRMIQRGQQASLTIKAQPPVGIRASNAAENLYRDIAGQPSVACAIPQNREHFRFGKVRVARREQSSAELCAGIMQRIITGTLRTQSSLIDILQTLIQCVAFLLRADSKDKRGCGRGSGGVGLQKWVPSSRIPVAGFHNVRVA